MRAKHSVPLHKTAASIMLSHPHNTQSKPFLSWKLECAKLVPLKFKKHTVIIMLLCYE